jgi:hypothetical protein
MPKANTSSAVKQQRNNTKDVINDFPTPCWATRGLIEKIVLPLGYDLKQDTAWEPCCNRGHMAEPMKEYFGQVVCSDKYDYGYSGTHFLADFLDPNLTSLNVDIDWLMFNPPFVLAEEFILKGLVIAKKGVICIVRSAFLESVGRYNNLFKDQPPTIVAQSVERIPMVEGRYDPKAASATAYSWLIWLKDREPMPAAWVPPCRVEFERESDWPTTNG